MTRLVSLKPRVRLYSFLAVAICLLAGVVIAMGSDFEETKCVVSREGGYVSITLSDGVREKAVNFVSDGITYWSQLPGGSSAEGYEGVSKLVYEVEGSALSGTLSIEFKDATREPNIVGKVENECWQGLTQLMNKKSDTSHIQLEERARRLN